jgi:rubrerythrin
MKPTCVHSCKGICNALDQAERREREAIQEYRQYVDLCDYPDVREIMKALIEERERGLKLLQEKREVLTVKFNMIDRINESFL